MEWQSAEPSGAKSVPVPDELVGAVIEAIDRPRGSFPLDPYADARIAAYRLPELRSNLEGAIAARREQLRLETFRRLRADRLEPWAEGMLAHIESQDRLLAVLSDIAILCEAGDDVVVLAQ